MRPAVSRLLVVACTALAAASEVPGAARAAPVPAPCAAHVAARFTNTATDADVHRMTVVLSSTGNGACTLRGFPSLAIPALPGTPLPVGHVTLPREVVLAPGATAAFGIGYTTSPGTTAAPCSLSVVVNGLPAAADGTIPVAACTGITQIDVTSYASGAQPPPIAVSPTVSAGGAPCAAHDLALREIRAVAPSELTPGATFALQNQGAASCRIAGVVGIRLMDANGTAFALRFAVRTTMAMLLTLPPGYEASFTVAYAPHAQRCVASASIAVLLPAQPEPIAAPSTIAACTGADVRVSNLRMGVAVTPAAFGPG